MGRPYLVGGSTGPRCSLLCIYLLEKNKVAKETHPSSGISAAIKRCVYILKPNKKIT